MHNTLSDWDTQKLHAENGQLRNQQFQITLASLAFFGVGNGWILGSSKSDIEYIITVCILLILGVAFFWSRILKHHIDVISVYLKIRKLSLWEYDYREYSHLKPKISQTRYLAIVYMLLGFSSVVVLIIDNHNHLKILWKPFLLPVGVLVLYIAIIFIYGWRKPILNEGNILKNWKQAIKKSESERGHKRWNMPGDDAS